jgi:hypothetical protein
VHVLRFEPSPVAPVLFPSLARAHEKILDDPDNVECCKIGERIFGSQAA